VLKNSLTGFSSPARVCFVPDALSLKAKCGENQAIDAGATERRPRVVVRLESLGHGGAQKGDQESVQDRFEEGQGVRRIDRVPQTQDRRPLPGLAAVTVRGQEQSRAVGEGEVGQERNRAAFRRFGQGENGAQARERDDEDASGGAPAVRERGQSRQTVGCEIASKRRPAERAVQGARPLKPGAPDSAVERDEEGAAAKAAKSSGQRQGFKLNEFVVYPAHGVGQIVAVEDQEVAGFRLELFVINFAKDKMTLRVPTSKVVGVGMRKLSEPEAAKRSLEILTGRARIKRTMWSRRAQEYEAKINSGDINAIAEVVRDLYRSDAQPEQSYSERQLYEAALDRMMREIAAVQKLSEIDALKVIDAQLKKAQRRGTKSEGAEGEDAAIEEAA